MNFQSMLYGLGEALIPVLRNSKFKEDGVITPDEFVTAGDFLEFKCPTWRWESGDKSKRRPYLPHNKQYLITRNVICYKRVAEIESLEFTDIDNNDWITTNSSTKILKKDEIPDIEELEEFKEFEDPAEYKYDQKHRENIEKHRTYDLLLTYDKYYQTPRLWLLGYDEHGRPLNHQQIFQDISEDHANKTVTIEQFPHSNLSLVSIHPCKHANVMKLLIERSEGNNKEVRVDQYLMIFLKFMSCIIPTIDYDHTVAV